MICAACGQPRGRDFCPQCSAAALAWQVLERHAADAEGRKAGNLFRERELAALKFEGVRWSVEVLTQRSHRADARAADLERQVARLEGRLGVALANYEQLKLDRDELADRVDADGELSDRAADLERRLGARDDGDQAALDLAFAALKAVEPAVKPCQYLEPCGQCPSCRYKAALAGLRERFPEETGS